MIVTLQSGSGPYGKEWLPTDWHCPTCGDKSVWEEQDSAWGDEGETQLCVNCGTTFNFGCAPHTADGHWAGDTLSQLRA